MSRGQGSGPHLSTLPSVFQLPSAGLLVSPMLPPSDADNHTHSRVSPPHPSHTPRDRPLSLKLREGKHPARQCTEGTSHVGLDPWIPMPEVALFHKGGACPDIAERKEGQEEASRKPKMDASRESRSNQASHPTPAMATTITAAPS